MAVIREWAAIKAVPVVSSLPDAFAGALVLLSSDGKLYISDGAGWSVAF